MNISGKMSGLHLTRKHILQDVAVRLLSVSPNLDMSFRTQSGLASRVRHRLDQAEGSDVGHAGGFRDTLRQAR